jgi:hypothetical protein
VLQARDTFKVVFSSFSINTTPSKPSDISSPNAFSWASPFEAMTIDAAPADPFLDLESWVFDPHSPLLTCLRVGLTGFNVIVSQEKLDMPPTGPALLQLAPLTLCIAIPMGYVLAHICLETDKRCEQVVYLGQ